MNDVKVKERYNMPVTILLICGLITIIFPLYMTIVIAFKQPSEMTNSIAGLLSLPKSRFPAVSPITVGFRPHLLRYLARSSCPFLSWQFPLGPTTVQPAAPGSVPPSSPSALHPPAALCMVPENILLPFSAFLLKLNLA